MKILVGISGSIAAYKAPMLVREFIKRGDDVRVVCSPSALNFVSAVALQNLIKHPIAVEMFADDTQNAGSWHIHLARWCDVMMIAPCSAATMGKIAHGISDTALTLVALALPPEKPLYIAPAMDTEMWVHPATQRNRDTLRSYGAHIIPPAEGELASGFYGAGRLPELDVLVAAIHRPNAPDALNTPSTPNTPTAIIAHPTPETPLAGKTVLITAGPTYERIDDVRFIGNYSSGKMGYALAAEAQRLGARVLLVSGPVALETPNQGGVPITRINVESAQEMYGAVMKHRSETAIFILSAAVADFTPTVRHLGKIKKSALEQGTVERASQSINQQAGILTLELRHTPDILAALGKVKEPHQILVGFALEAANYEDNALKKLHEKRCDMIVLNAANKSDSGFRGDNNTITLLHASGEKREFPPMSKRECAVEIWEEVKRSMKFEG
jgi:phosphopantothenoylcysteine decarboxylase/phosphopantothenate--cysteine ligase